MSTATVDEILRYKKTLEESPSEDEILDVFNFLESLEIDRTILSKTKIGITVTKHKQNENPAIASRSRKLVEKWRAIVSHTAKAKAPAPQLTSESSGSIDVPGNNQSIFSDEKSTGSDPFDYLGPRCGDVKRDKAREILYRAFVEGMPVEQLAEIDISSASRLIGSIEESLWEHHIEKKNANREYQTQLRSIKSNFADKKNPEFNIRVYLGAISTEKIAVMVSTEMASDAKKAERLKAKKDALEACQSDWDLRNVKRAAGQFPCGKCKSVNTMYFQMQTRSSDEPMTTFVSCIDCGNRWKF